MQNKQKIKATVASFDVYHWQNTVHDKYTKIEVYSCQTVICNMYLRYTEILIFPTCHFFEGMFAPMQKS